MDYTQRIKVISVSDSTFIENVMLLYVGSSTVTDPEFLHYCIVEFLSWEFLIPVFSVYLD
jgi:hypothetical protein